MNEQKDEKLDVILDLEDPNKVQIRIKNKSFKATVGDGTIETDYKAIGRFLNLPKKTYTAIATLIEEDGENEYQVKRSHKLKNYKDLEVYFNDIIPNY